MKTLSLKKVLISLALSFLAIICFVFSMNVTTGKAIAVEDATISMQHGARVRAAGIEDGRNGISWQLVMDAEDYAVESDTVSYGVLIAPVDYGTLSEETVFGEKPNFWWVDEESQVHGNQATGKQIWNLETEELTAGNGVYYFNASLVDLHESNVTREFIGVGYMKYELAGKTEYTFAEDNSNARTMTYVALRYLESDQNTLTDKEAEAFRAEYVKEKTVDVTFDLAGTEQTEQLTLAISETYSANQLAKMAGVSLDGLIPNNVSEVKIANDTDEISGINFVAVESKDLAGTYALADGTLKLEFDGTASVTKGESTAYGNWKMAFDNKTYSNVAMVATDTVDNSYIAQIEKTETAYQLVEDDKTYAQTESSYKTLVEGLDGTYVRNRDNIYGYTTTDSWYNSAVIYASENKISYNSTGKKDLKITPITNLFGKIDISESVGNESSKFTAYYTKVDGEYYLYLYNYNNSIRHPIQYYKTKKLDITDIREKLAGEYYVVKNNSQSARFTIYDNSEATMTKSDGLSNCMLVKKGTDGNGFNGYIDNRLNIIPTSRTTGYLRFANAQGYQSSGPAGLVEYAIIGDDVIIHENSGYGMVITKSSNPGEPTTQVVYHNIVKKMFAGNYIGINGLDLSFDADGKAGTYNGKEFTVTSITPTVGFYSGTDATKNIFSGSFVITFADNSAETVKYDFSSGRTILTVNGINAMQIR